MRRAVVVVSLLLAAALGGCKNDPCAGQAGVCIAARIEGTARGLDQLAIEIGGQTVSTPTPPKAFSLPVLVAIFPPAAVQDGATHAVTLTGLGAGVPIAGVEQDVLVPRAGHSSVTFVLGAPTTPGDGGDDLADADTDGGDLCVPGTCGASDVAMTMVGCGMSMDCGPPSIFDVVPQNAATGQVISIEGRFGTATSATVHFPGTDAQADSVTPTRLFVTVPFQATAGQLTVSVGGQTSNSAFIRRLSFAVGANAFRRAYEQTTYARTMPTLRGARRSAARTIAGGFLWVMGGTDITGPTSSIERAMVNADGTLGEFVAQATTLLSPRAAGHATVIGDRIYVVAGSNTGGLTSVEYTTVQADHTLAPFTDAGVSLLGGHALGAVAVIGRWLYVFAGGLDASIERAPIRADNSLGPFVAAGSLPTTLNGATVLVSGNNLYLIGGVTPAGFVSTILRAPIAGDGSLGTFADAGVSLAHARNLHKILTVRDKVFIIGGQDMSGALASVEMATIAPDGTLGAFADTGTPLNTARDSATAVLVDNRIHVIGGHGAVLLGTTEVAQINGSGAIGSFANLGGTHLTMQQINHCAAVIGSFVYVFGGRYADVASHAVTMRAPIHPDGTLGDFVDAGVNLDAIRENANVAITGDRVYVLGGLGTVGNTYITSNIQDDATLAAFSGTTGTSMGGSNRSELASVMIQDRYFGLGGYDGTNSLSTLLYVNLDAGARHFQGNPSGYNTGTVAIGTTRSLHAPIVLDPLLYVIGGQSTTSTAAQAIYAGPITWSSSDVATFVVQTPALTKLRYQPGVAVIGNKLYVLGGHQGGAGANDYDSATIATDGTLGALTQSATGTLGANGRSNAPALVLGNYVYMFGGVSPGTQTDTVVAAPLN